MRRNTSCTASCASAASPSTRNAAPYIERWCAVYAALKAAGSAKAAPVVTGTLYTLLKVQEGESAAMSNRDRLTGLDASFLALEKGGAHMHVGSVLVFEGDSPAYDDLGQAFGGRLHGRGGPGAGEQGPPASRPPLPPAARLPPVRRLAARVGRRRALQRPLPRAPHRAARAGGRRAASPAGRARVLAAARPRQAALGDLAGGPRGRRPLRADLQDPPRAGGRHLRRGHPDRVVRSR